MDYLEESKVAGFLTAAEREELAKLSMDSRITGHAVFNGDGEELAGEGLFEETVPVFANLFDIADKIGEELGEESHCRVIVADSQTDELSGIALMAVNAIFRRRKHRATEEGLRSVR